MKLILLPIALLFGYSTCQACFTQKSDVLYSKYLKPILEELEPANKYYLYQIPEEIGLRNGPSFDSILVYKYGIDSTMWKQKRQEYKLHQKLYCEWPYSIDKRKMNKLLRVTNSNGQSQSKRSKISIFSASHIVFLTELEYIIQITQYCPGVCSVTRILFIEIIETENVIDVKINEMINVGGS